MSAAGEAVDALPLSLKLAGRPCLVVGGGDVARRKIELLLKAKAQVEVVAPTISPRLRTLGDAAGVSFQERPFAAADVRGRVLVVAATGETAVNQAVFDACERHGVLVNCVDDAKRSSVLFPAIVDRGAVSVAIATGGASPTLARRLRERIEAVLPASLGALADYLASRRQRIKEALPDVRRRQRFWDRAIDGELARLVARNDLEGADAALRRILREPAATGFVSLVGAGPGDADLLTVKALRCLQQADVVYYDGLVGKLVLERCRRDAKLVDVGRRSWTRPPDGQSGDVAGPVSARQAHINARLLADAGDGLRVVRLKGGDPLLFGRGGEEIHALARGQVPFEVVPGVTAALGCAAVAGIPLTHRDFAQSVRFVTARQKDGAINADWPELARPGQTLVLYMGLEALATICRQLRAHGASPQTPAATVCRATLPDEAVVVGCLDDLPAKVRAAGLVGPATTIVGGVVGLAGAPR